MSDDFEPYRLYDNQTRAFVNQKEYQSEKSANRIAERRNLEYGGHRYSAEKYSDVVRRNTPKAGGAGRAAGIDVEGMGGLKPGQSPSLENMIRQAKGGKVSASKRADGAAKRGKTRGKLI